MMFSRLDSKLPMNLNWVVRSLTKIVFGWTFNSVSSETETAIAQSKIIESQYQNIDFHCQASEVNSAFERDQFHFSKYSIKCFTHKHQKSTSMRSNYWKLARVIGNALVIFSSEEYFRLGSTLGSKFQLFVRKKMHADYWICSRIAYQKKLST